MDILELPLVSYNIQWTQTLMHSHQSLETILASLESCSKHKYSIRAQFLHCPHLLEWINYNNSVQGELIFSAMAAGWFCEKSG